MSVSASFVIFESSGGISCGWMMGADTIRLGFGSNLCLFLWGWACLGLVWFISESTGWWVLRERERGRERVCACCCRSGELMVLPKPDSIWILDPCRLLPKRVGMLRTWFLVLFWTGFVSILGVRSWTNPSFLGSSPLYFAFFIPHLQPNLRLPSSSSNLDIDNPAQFKDFDSFHHIAISC